MKIIAQIIITFFTLNLAAQSTYNKAYSIGEKHSIYSKILQEDRVLFIHVPQGFWGMDERLERYPVTFVLDGESQFLNAVSAIDFLSSSPLGNDKMPRTIIVGIPNTNRNRDLTPTKGIIGKDSTTLEITGGGPKFLDFIVNEVEPYLDSLYSISEHRTIIGHSLGGLIVLEALLNKRAHFDNYLTIDPFLRFDKESYFNRVLDTLRNANLEGENLFLATASTLPTFLNSQDLKEDTSEIVKLTKSNLKFQKIVSSEKWNFNFHYQHFSDENHFSVPYIATYEAMKFFYRYYAFPKMINYYHPSFSEKLNLIEHLEKHYQDISTHLGYKVLPMESYLYSWAYGFYQFERRDLTIDLFDYNLRLYPNRPSVYNSKGYFLLNEGKEAEAMELFEASLILKKDEKIIEVLKELKD